MGQHDKEAMQVERLAAAGERSCFTTGAMLLVWHKIFSYT